MPLPPVGAARARRPPPPVAPSRRSPLHCAAAAPRVAGAPLPPRPRSPALAALEGVERAQRPTRRRFSRPPARAGPSPPAGAPRPPGRGVPPSSQTVDLRREARRAGRPVREASPQHAGLKEIPWRRALPLLVLAATLSGCGEEELLHGLDEVQANEILVALDEGGLAAEKRRGDGSDAQWTVSVSAATRRPRPPNPRRARAPPSSPAGLRGGVRQGLDGAHPHRGARALAARARRRALAQRGEHRWS